MTPRHSQLVLLGALLGAALLTGRCGPKTGCQNGADAPGFCYCPSGESCDHRCTSEPTCALDCANGNPSCSVSCRDQCSILCQGAGECTGSCGSGCLVACQGSGRCIVTVGEDADVRCEQSRDCEVSCTGRCAVGCADATCRVHCPGGSCRVACTKDEDAGATLCADGITYACGVSC